MKILKLFLILPLAALLMGAKIYKWVDENGRVHFGSQPPPQQMERVVDTGLGKSGGGNPSAEAEEVIQNRWWANAGDKVVYLRVSSYGYDWNEYTGGKYPTSTSGKWNLLSTAIEMTSKEGVTKRYAVKNVRKYSMTLIDTQTEERFNFKRLHEDRYDLSEREEEISGDWAEVSLTNENQVISRIRFDSGIFQRYYLGSFSERIEASPNPNMVNAKGQWRVGGDVLTMEYVETYEGLWKMSGEVEEWKIDQLDFRNLRLTNLTTQEQKHFRRKRED